VKTGWGLPAAAADCRVRVAPFLQRARHALAALCVSSHETFCSFLLGRSWSLPLQMSTRGLPLNSAPSISHMLSAAFHLRHKRSRTQRAAPRVTLIFHGCLTCRCHVSQQQQKQQQRRRQQQQQRQRRQGA
jgi:hypothetical protein